MRPSFEVADVLDAQWSEAQHSGSFNTWQLRALDALRRCRTASPGSHADGCSSCGHLRLSYNSCRNRHCPKCQGTACEKWVQAREEELCLCLIFMWSLPCPKRSTNCVCISPGYCMTCCSKQHGVCSVVLVMTISGLEHKQV